MKESPSTHGTRYTERSLLLLIPASTASLLSLWRKGKKPLQRPSSFPPRSLAGAGLLCHRFSSLAAVCNSDVKERSKQEMLQAVSCRDPLQWGLPVMPCSAGAHAAPQKMAARGGARSGDLSWQCLLHYLDTKTSCQS